jgi:hypothetical protein
MKKRSKAQRQRVTVKVPVKQNSFAPLCLIDTMKYTDEYQTKTNGGQQYSYWRYKANSCYDFNSLALSGGLSAFAELATLYREYKVLSVSIRVVFSNNEAFPVVISYAPSDIDLSTIVTGATPALNLAELPYSKRVELAAKGGQDRAVISARVDLPRLSGHPSLYRDSLDYGALVNADPARMLYLNFAIVSTSNLTSVGVTQQANFQLRVRWTQRQTPVISSLFTFVRMSEEERQQRAIVEYLSCQKIGAFLRLPTNPNQLADLVKFKTLKS